MQQPDLGHISNKKVLIINDDEHLCVLLQLFFLRRNCEVEIIYSAAEALEKTAGITPEVIVFDPAVCADRDAFTSQLQALAPAAEIIVVGA